MTTTTIKPIKCSFCGLEGNSKNIWTPKEYGEPLCGKHAQQFKKYGKCFTHTWRDKNRIDIFDTHAEIVILDIRNEEKHRVMIDIEDVELVSNYKWSTGKGSNLDRAWTKKDGKHVFIYNLIMDNDVSSENRVDHINRNPLDNRRSNLRICSALENNRNTNQSAKPTVGVSWSEPMGKWRARINLNGKEYRLGYFDNKEDAIKARQEAEKKMFGEYAPIERRCI